MQYVFHPVSTETFWNHKQSAGNLLNRCGHPRKVKSDAPKPPKLLKDPKAEKEAKEAKAEAKAAAEEKTMELLKDMC